MKVAWREKTRWVSNVHTGLGDIVPGVRGEDRLGVGVEEVKAGIIGILMPSLFGNKAT